jgi:radical S-adenosyl methionine domain-containing protein 2
MLSHVAVDLDTRQDANLPFSAIRGQIFSGLPVNFHLTRACNFSCGHCFATFQDVSKPSAATETLQIQVVSTLADRGAAKITFSGGEPLLVSWLPALLRRAHILGVTTCVVTNGSLLSREWLAGVAGDLDWLTLSVDSLVPATNLRVGRVTKKELAGNALDRGAMLAQSAMDARDLGIGLKINTVVTRHNADESLTDFIGAVVPTRWKIMQAMSVLGQQQQSEEYWGVTEAEFDAFVSRHRATLPTEVAIVPEPVDVIRGSYIMVDPWGRIFESVSGRHRYHEPVERASASTIDKALSRQKLLDRDGLWSWDRALTHAPPI